MARGAAIARFCCGSLLANLTGGVHCCVPRRRLILVHVAVWLSVALSAWILHMLYLFDVFDTTAYACAAAVLSVVVGVFIAIAKRDNLQLHAQLDAVYKPPVAPPKPSASIAAAAATVSAADDEDDADVQRAPFDDGLRADPDALGVAARPKAAAAAVREADDLQGSASNATNDETSVSATLTASALPSADHGDHTLSDDNDEPSLSATVPSPAARRSRGASAGPGPLAFIAPRTTVSFVEFDFSVVAPERQRAEILETVRAIFAVDGSSIEEGVGGNADQFMLRLHKPNVDLMHGSYGVTSTLQAIPGIWHAAERSAPDVAATAGAAPNDNWAARVADSSSDSDSDVMPRLHVQQPQPLRRFRVPHAQQQQQQQRQAAAAAAPLQQQQQPAAPVVQRGGVRMPAGWTRVDLEMLMHRDFSSFDAYFAVPLGVAAMGMALACFVLLRGYSIFLCFGVAGAVFSLFKMPSPDGGSAVLAGTESARGRAVMIVLLGALLWISHAGALALGTGADAFVSVWYGQSVYPGHILATVESVLLVVLAMLPMLFALGVLPTRPSTLIMFIVEQIDRVVLGASAATCTSGAIMSLLQGAFIVALAFVVGGFGSRAPPLDLWHRGAMIAVLFTLTYAKSRWPSDVALLWPAVKALARAAVVQLRCSCMGGERNSSKKDKHKRHDKPPAPAASPPAAVATAAAPAAAMVDPNAYPADRLKRDLRHAVLVFVLTFVAQVLLGIEPAGVGAVTTPFAIALLILVALGELLLEARRQFPFGLLFAPVFANNTVTTDFMAAGRRSTITRPQIASAWLNVLLRNVVWPVWLIVAGLEAHARLTQLHGAAGGLVLTLLPMHALLRRVWSAPNNMVPPLALLTALLVVNCDLRRAQREATLLDVWLAAAFVERVIELVLKMHFIVVYAIRSWITVDVGPKLLAIPHSLLITVELIASCILSVPLSPIAGAGVFLLGYARPVKYWEVEYKTKFRGAATTRMDRLGIDTDTENSNAVFYEHLLAGMRSTIVGHVQAGRFGRVAPGDVFLLVNESLTAVVHFVELGNGHCSFQLRGLEFGGTYCQQQELLGVTELIDGQQGRQWPHRSLSRTWTVESRDVLLPSYSVASLPAGPLFAAYANREAFVASFVRAIIYCLTEAEQGDAVERWARVPELTRGLEVDTVISESMAGARIDRDFDDRRGGITLISFHQRYGAWLEHCLKQRDAVLAQRVPAARAKPAAAAPAAQPAAKAARVRDENNDNDSMHSAATDDSEGGSGSSSESDPDGAAAAPAPATPRKVTSDACGVTSTIARLALLTTVFARRVVWPSSTDRLDSTLFIARVRASLAGDMRMCSVSDEWALRHIDELMNVVRRALRFALQLQLDRHASGGEDDDNDLEALFDALELYEPSRRQFCICDEADPQWRDAILNDVPHLVSMRTVQMPRSIDYYVSRGERGVGRFSVVRVNRESVRALWSAQQNELLYLANTNSERGSIQQLRPCLRNVINQSCDSPVGYPIFVAPIASAFEGEVMRELYASKPAPPAASKRRKFGQDDGDVELQAPRRRSPAQLEARAQGGARPVRRFVDDWFL